MFRRSPEITIERTHSNAVVQAEIDTFLGLQKNINKLRYEQQMIGRTKETNKILAGWMTEKDESWKRLQHLYVEFNSGNLI